MHDTWCFALISEEGGRPTLVAIVRQAVQQGPQFVRTEKDEEEKHCAISLKDLIGNVLSPGQVRLICVVIK
jgi:hypothetical protein